MGEEGVATGTRTPNGGSSRPRVCPGPDRDDDRPAHRINWHCVEEAICKERPREAGVATRRFCCSGASTQMPHSSGSCSCCSRPSLLICGAIMHISGGVSNQRQLLPIGGVAAARSLQSRGFIRENGSTTARAQHFTANGGLISARTCPVMLHVHRAPAMLEEALPAYVCWRLGFHAHASDSIPVRPSGGIAGASSGACNAGSSGPAALLSVAVEVVLGECVTSHWRSSKERCALSSWRARMKGLIGACMSFTPS